MISEKHFEIKWLITGSGQNFTGHAVNIPEEPPINNKSAPGTNAQHVIYKRQMKAFNRCSTDILF